MDILGRREAWDGDDRPFLNLCMLSDGTCSKRYHCAFCGQGARVDDRHFHSTVKEDGAEKKQALIEPSGQARKHGANAVPVKAQPQDEDFAGTITLEVLELLRSESCVELLRSEPGVCELPSTEPGVLELTPTVSCLSSKSRD